MSLRRAEITEIIRQRVFSGLHLGILRHRGRLPSVRELSRELGANPRVILAAYHSLEREGLVELKTRSGIFVASPEASMGDPTPRRTDWMVDVLIEGLQHGLIPRALSQQVAQCLDAVDLQAAVLECNADQLYSVPEELERDFGIRTIGVEIEALRGRKEVPAELREVDLLVTTGFHQSEVREMAQRLGTPLIGVTMCTDLFTEVGRLLPLEPVYFIVSDPRFAAKLHRLFASTTGAANLRTLVFESDDLSQVPDDAPTYLTRLTRRRLKESSLLSRVLPEDRVFSAESARQILSFLIRANSSAPASRR
ncbi:MAG: GntR family transcriptional regulator [Gemmatimonadales bacterium]|nr:GntR family transcriptional regulator [Gemmatimonadales bacterium]MDQ3428193.1 GntR family transcriptional regulator [Gemmatimonadota bacterium]